MATSINEVCKIFEVDKSNRAVFPHCRFLESFAAAWLQEIIVVNQFPTTLKFPKNLTLKFFWKEIPKKRKKLFKKNMPFFPNNNCSNVVSTKVIDI